MKKKVLLIVCCLFGVLLTYAQSSKQSAKSVWEEFQANPTKMYTFIDGITNSDSPKDFIPYVQRFVAKSINRGVDWDVLYDEMKETILPKDPDVATYFGVSLAQMTYSYSKMIKALGALPKKHTFDNDFIERAAIYPDGRIAIVMDGEENRFKYGVYIEPLLATFCGTYTIPRMAEPFWQYRQILLYQPEGNSMLGMLKYAGTKDDYSYTIPTAKENDKLDLYIGIYLNKQGEKVGEKCMQYNSFAQANEAEANAYKAQQDKVQSATDRKVEAVKKTLVQKYGQRAYNAMDAMRPYEGMPEGIVRDFTVVSQDRVFKAYGFSHVVGVYKVYRPTSSWKFAARLIRLQYPSAIYIKGGKVAAVKW